MKTIRSLYTYLITLISLEVVTWGMIRLARTFTNPQIEGNAGQLAGALALILVGLPIFLLHWWMAQRQAAAEEEERFCIIRAIFFYGAFLGALIPIIQNTLALVNRFLINIFQQPSYMSIFGGRQIWSDNLIAIFMNALLGGYVFYSLQKDWDATPPNDNLSNIRRLARYILLIYGLGMLVGGVHEVIRYLFSFARTIGATPQNWLANGLALLIVGIPLWIVVWRIIQRSLQHFSERTALLRQIILFLISLFSAVGILVPLGIIIKILVEVIFGGHQAFGVVLMEIGEPLALALPLGGVWAYYSRALYQTFNAEPFLKRGDLFRKLYYYILSALGLIATLIGLQMLFAFIIDLSLRSTALWGGLLRERLAAALASLVVGLPIWLSAWKLMLADVAEKGEAGERARRSLVRKTYLYIALFVGVIGAMISSGYASFILFKALLGQVEPDLLAEVLTSLSQLLIFGGLLAYHLSLLRSDKKMAQRFLSDLHAQFPVLILTTQNGAFASQAVTTFQREMPSLPLAVHAIENGVPDETMSQARAVIIPGDIVAEPNDAIRVWLKNFSGQRLAIPTSAKNWHWLFGSGRGHLAMIKRTVKIVREMAEGDEISSSRDRSSWQNILYFFGVLFSIELLFSLVSFLMSLIFD
ncbi:MAG: hypothetical protein DRI56_02990 [Chloroflexota bacterium]|nr:MAG: hypothetical protein DRI56_02990 [Chloroflexota bacterium]